MPEEPESTWSRIREQLREDTTDLTFHVWLEPLRLAGRRGATLFVAAPPHIRAWVRERQLPLLTDSASTALGERVAIEVVDEQWTDESPRPGGVASGAGDGLNPKYTFDQFVIGAGNRLAHAAALAVAELPAQAYNPLFLYGPPGLGKTHLRHAIGNYLWANARELRVRYATVEEFTTRFIESLQQRRVEAFRRAFRDVDVLLIDDAQFLADKERTREEFFHTFNELYEAGHQLVITSDQAPSSMEQLETRLRERFSSGLVASIDPPDFEVRLAILRKRARLDAIGDVSEETLAEIARRVNSSVRALEGALVRVVALASLRGEAASPATAGEVLARLYPVPARVGCNLGLIQERTAAAFGLPTEALLARDRRPRVALARQVAMYLARELTDETLPAIATSFGRQNHTTVLRAHRRVTEGLEAGRESLGVVDGLRRQLESDHADRPR